MLQIADVYPLLLNNFMHPLVDLCSSNGKKVQTKILYVLYVREKLMFSDVFVSSNEGGGYYLMMHWNR